MTVCLTTMLCLETFACYHCLSISYFILQLKFTPVAPCIWLVLLSF